MLHNKRRKRLTKDIVNNVLFYEYIIANMWGTLQRGKLSHTDTLQFALLKYLYIAKDCISALLSHEYSAFIFFEFNSRSYFSSRWNERDA